MKYYEFHGHLALGEGTLDEKLERLRENGVVYFRDGGSRIEQLMKMGDLKAVKARAAEFGVQYETPVAALHKKGLYGDYLGESFDSVFGDGEFSFRKKVLEMKSLGADYIKVMYSGIASYKNIGELSCAPLTFEEITEIVNICHAEGLKVMAHCNGTETIKNAIAAGTDSIEHGIFIDMEGLSMLANSGAVWVPTITAIANEDIKNYHIRCVKKGVQMGVQILPGSDSGSKIVEHGIGTINEYKLLESCGLQINLHV